MARRCRAKHICKSKCTKHHIRGAILDVYAVEKWHAAVARSTFASENAKKLTVSEPFWTLRC